MDAFYASVEQLDRPELRGRPIIVGSPSARGVVLTASYEARPFGVRSAMPALQARDLCPDCLFVPPRMKRYAEIARQIRSVFEQFTPLVEPISLDEAFLDITGSLRLFGGARPLAEELKRRVREQTGLTISVGIGPTKMIAKIASDLRKPDGLVEVPATDAVEFLRPLPVGRLWGVGPATLSRLERLGIHRIGDLARTDRTRLQSALGNQADALLALSRAEDGREVAPDRQRKSYGEENTFEHNLRDGPRIRAIIREHAEAVARRLRSDRRTARAIVLKLKLTNRIGPGKYPILTRRQTLPAPTDDGPTIAATALSLWQAAHEGRAVRLIGVSASEIEAAESSAQLGLFDDGGRRRTALNRALDEINTRFGTRTVARGDATRRR